MEFKFDTDWILQPIKGDTGHAYRGEKNSEKAFIKRNSTPFLAALSQEGLTPKLLWTKRTSSGDILTAQEWQDGYTLSKMEIKGNIEIINILRHLHHSVSLKSLFEKIGGERKDGWSFLNDYQSQLPASMSSNIYLNRVYRYLVSRVSELPKVELCPCHGDAIHHNWLLSRDKRLYLVDWDCSVLADPALDLATILWRYIPSNEWITWLTHYGLNWEPELAQRIEWYGVMQVLLQIKRHTLKNEKKEVSQNIKLLQQKGICMY